MNTETEHECPHCGTVLRIWKKTIISTAAASLCRLVSMNRVGPVHLDEFTVLAKDRNFSQLALWHLIRPGHNDDITKRASGMWESTARGRMFVRGIIRLPKYVVTCNNKVLRFEGPDIGIKNSLNNKFDYSELIGNNILEMIGHEQKELFG